MSRSQKLEPVRDIAQKTVDDEMQILIQLQGAYQQGGQQLTELQGYRNEYLQQFHNDQSSTARQALDMRMFLAQLDQAVAAQQQVVNQLFSRLEVQRQKWFTAKNKVQAIEKLMLRYQNEAERLAQKREQRETDEYSQAMWLRKR